MEKAAKLGSLDENRDGWIHSKGDHFRDCTPPVGFAWGGVLRTRSRIAVQSMAPSQLFQPVKTAPPGAYSFFHPPHGLCVRFGVEKGLDGFLVLPDRKGPKAFAKQIRAKGVADQPRARLSCACTREDIRRNGMMSRHRLTGKKVA